MQITVSHFTKIQCGHCEHLMEAIIAYPLVVPKEIICMECGQILEGYRRVSRADGKVQVWIKYQ